jgi:hypothetical protein
LPLFCFIACTSQMKKDLMTVSVVIEPLPTFSQQERTGPEQDKCIPR